MLNALDLSELPAAFTPCEFRVKWADGGWEIDQARRLRRAVFCAEQGIFVGDDTDAIDAHAQPLVAVSQVGGMPDQVVGTVRIHQQHAGQPSGPLSGPPSEGESGIWWGSRLAVHAAFRHHGRLGATLIRLAVSSAHARGCRVFLAHVQEQNVPLFEKMRWATLSTQTLHGRAHALMQADLAHYPPCHDPLWGFAALSAARAVPA